MRDVSVKTKVRGGGAGGGGGGGDKGGSLTCSSAPQTCAPTTEPVWDEGFSFLIKRPHVESLELQVSAPSPGPLPRAGVPSPQRGGASRPGVLSRLCPQVKEEGGQPLGALSLPLPQLLASEGLTLDGWFPLAGGGPGSQVLLRVQLGVSDGVRGAVGGGVAGTFLTPPLAPQVLVSQQVEAGASSVSPAGGDAAPQPMEAPGEEEYGAGGLRQRLLPADR